MPPLTRRAAIAALRDLPAFEAVGESVFAAPLLATTANDFSEPHLIVKAHEFSELASTPLQQPAQVLRAALLRRQRTDVRQTLAAQPEAAVLRAITEEQATLKRLAAADDEPEATPALRLVRLLYAQAHSNHAAAPSVLSVRDCSGRMSEISNMYRETISACWGAAFDALRCGLITPQEIEEAEGRVMWLVPAMGLLRHMAYWLVDAGPQDLWVRLEVFADEASMQTLSPAFARCNAYVRGQEARLKRVLAGASANLVGQQSPETPGTCEEPSDEGYAHGKVLAAAINTAVLARPTLLNEILMAFWPELIATAPDFLAALPV